MGSSVPAVVEEGCESNKMCRPRIVSDLKWGEKNYVKSARKVVKKYKKMSLKKEMTRLRRLLPKGESLKQHEVLDQTILLIQQLEMKLLTRIQQTGIPQKIAMVTGETSTKSLDLDKLRDLVMTTMMNKKYVSTTS